VRYADTDAMGVAYYGNYLAFFETGRVEAMRQVGADYAMVVRRGLHIVVIEAAVRYRQPAVFDDVLLVSTHAADFGRTRFAFRYEIKREADGALIATGHTIHAAIDAQTRRAIRLPEWLLTDLRQLV
jgi:acyl-CoA thioester hydrolase